MNRRDFIHRTCQACAALAAIPIAGTLEGCASPVKSLAAQNGLVDVPVDLLGKSGRAVIKVAGLANKLMVVRRDDGEYTALELNCPHKNGPVKEKGGMLQCEWHGSSFDFDGKVTKGPSKSGLKSFPVEAAGTVLRVRVG
jgi:nitrite reductase/ring-hydroxylating ferredoxin subunit